ncbi:DUF4064 domain-containing protein [Salinicoccus sp. HZC-1]|uniref:DUF4064 domain-containing protein n=1 Tax=Salinicoccus sp. HZC-1 TaxID=3385497 RepID=UPI00398B4494
MAKKQYTQTVEPVSRIAERIFGWLAWIALLAITGLILFFSLVMVNDPAFIDSTRQQVQDVIAQQGSGEFSPDQMTEQVLNALNSSWMIALYLAIPLILGLFGLIMMRRRILAGFLLLIAGILTAPLVFAVITGLIPLFFVIAAILLFVRKDRVIPHDDTHTAGEERRHDDYDNRMREEDRADRSTAASAGAAGGAASRRQDDGDERTDDVKTYDRAQSDNSYENNDLEETRKFRTIDDETERDYRNRDEGRSDAGVTTYDDERLQRGDDRYVGNDNINGESDRYVDGNIDSRETTEPVTEEEYARRDGTSGFTDEVDGDDGKTLNDTEDKRRRPSKNDNYDYDASRERRNNLDRRNNGK